MFLILYLTLPLTFFLLCFFPLINLFLICSLTATKGWESMLFVGSHVFITAFNLKLVLFY